MVRIVKCVFWLGIVYAAIFTHGTFRWSELTWDVGGATSTHEASQAGAVDPRTVRLVGTLAAGTTFCARHADECLADAKRLTALFAEPEPLKEMAAAAGNLVAARDPRHTKRDAKPARTP